MGDIFGKPKLPDPPKLDPKKLEQQQVDALNKARDIAAIAAKDQGVYNQQFKSGQVPSRTGLRL